MTPVSPMASRLLLFLLTTMIGCRPNPYSDLNYAKLKTVMPVPRVGPFNPDRLDVGPKPGQLALEIEGVDLDGTPFKLSDYRGKVVLLEFFGNW